MKVYRIAIMLSLILVSGFPAMAAEKPTQKWDSLMEISHRFTWYPQKDLRKLLREKSHEYGQSLEEYQNQLISELTVGKKIKGLISANRIVKDKPWKLYYRLAISQFCIFLANNDKTYLQNAKTIFSTISGKKELVKVSFWYYLFQAYDHLIDENRNEFIKSVFALWNNCILKLELDTLVKQSYYDQLDQNNPLPYTMHGYA